MRTIKAVTDAVEIFNKYVKIRSEFFEAGLGPEDDCNFAALGERAGHLAINIEIIRDVLEGTDADKWMKISTEDATAEILRDRGMRRMAGGFSKKGQNNCREPNELTGLPKNGLSSAETLLGSRQTPSWEDLPYVGGNVSAADTWPFFFIYESTLV
jgi:hypothetical protein